MSVSSTTSPSRRLRIRSAALDALRAEQMAQPDSDGYVPGSTNQTDVDEEQEVPNVDEEDEGIVHDTWQPEDNGLVGSKVPVIYKYLNNIKKIIK